ncbi:MAG: hypothetical protein IKL79_02680 [Clostridia bacterium]|nr:hypothetical protein [Clostridia bacterium]MBR3680891.1 hypothetical protein [Clostridia bacterium]
MKKTICLVDCRIPKEAKRRLSLLGFEVMLLPPHPALSEAVASHTDMLICRLGDEVISLAEYCDASPYIFTDLFDYIGKSGKKIYFTDDRLSGEYPRDCALNCLKMGEYLFVKADTCSRRIIERARELGLTVVSVRQGYPACTVLRLDDRSAITADRGMAAAMSDVGITVYGIENGGIDLPPHEYGFIGGAAGVYNGCVYFVGNPDLHPSGKKIAEACEACGLDTVSLCDGRLVDVGGIAFIECDLD